MLHEPVFEVRISNRQPHLWCLYNNLTNQLVEGLLFDEARAFISNLQTESTDSWYVWREEWPDWRLVSEVDGLTEKIFRVMNVAPPPPPRVTGESSLELESDIEPLIQRNKIKQTDPLSPLDFSANEFVLRAQKRYNKRFVVVIIGPKNQQFKTHSKDISVGGIFLEDSLPDWISGYFKVRISKPNSKQLIELTCCLIENQRADQRFRIAILPLESEQDEKNLELWFAA